MAASRHEGKPAMTTEATTNEAATRKFSVLYAVTRGEYYQIEAANEEEARDRAFTDGDLVEVGETTDVVPCEVDEIDTFTAPIEDVLMRNAARDLLEAAQDPDLDAAHDKLSALLEDDDAGNDDIRDAALDLCSILNAHHEKRTAAIAKATPEHKTS